MHIFCEGGSLIPSKLKILQRFCPRVCTHLRAAEALVPLADSARPLTLKIVFQCCPDHPMWGCSISSDRDIEKCATLKHLLMLYLEIEVSSEPIIEEPWGHVGGGDGLSHEPVAILLLINVHRQVRHLGDQGEPEAVKHPAVEIKVCQSGLVRSCESVACVFEVCPLDTNGSNRRKQECLVALCSFC